MEFCKKEMIQIKDGFWTAIQQENGIQQKDLWNTLEKKQLLLTGAWRTKNVGEDMTAFATVLMAKQMLTQEVNGNYGDKIEQELYNAILCKLEENATEEQQFYPLPEWIQESIYSVKNSTIYTHLYIENNASFCIEGEHIFYEITTDYPLEETITIQLQREQEQKELTVAFRLPSWCRDFAVLVNGECAIGTIEDGYLYITNAFPKETEIVLQFAMPVRVIRNQSVCAETVGKVAVMRGPVVYCVEAESNESEVHRLFLDTEAEPEVVEARNGVRSCQALVVSGFYLKEDGYEEVYSFEREEYYEPKQLILLPYYFCGEGDETEKLVWINRL